MEAAEKGGNPVAAALKDVGAIADPGVEPFLKLNDMPVIMI